MENYSRRDTEMQSTMHELPHGSNSHKSRREYLKWVPLVIGFIFIQNKTISYLMWAITFAIAFYSVTNSNEPKPETSYKIVPKYHLNRSQLLVMLRNSQKEKS